MMLSEEDEIKKRMMERKMLELQSSAFQEQAQVQQAQQAVKKITSQILDNRARERLSNLRTVKPELAMQLEVYLAQMHQLGQIKGKITDEQLVMILKKIGEKKEFRIRRG